MKNVPEYQKLRAVKEAYAARLSKLAFEEKERTLANIAEVNTRQFVRTQQLAEHILGIPEKITDSLAAESDTRNAEDLLENAIREVLVAQSEDPMEET